MKTKYYGNTEAKELVKPVFIGKKWTLEVAKLPTGKIAGYVTHAISADTTAFNDPNYSSRPAVQNIPKTVRAKLERMMRKAGWVEDIWAKLTPDYIRSLVAKGNGTQVPAEYADISMARLYYPGDVNYSMYVEHYRDSKMAYELWTGQRKGMRIAMRNAGEKLPVYSHDLVDKH